MKVAKIAFTIHDVDSDERVSQKLRVFTPKFKDLPKYMMRYIEPCEQEEKLYLLKMLMLSQTYKTDDIVRNKMLDLQKYVSCGLLNYNITFGHAEPHNNAQRKTNTYEDMLFNALYYKKKYTLNMEYEEYLEFKNNILDELETVEKQLQRLVEEQFVKFTSTLPLIKRIKFYLLKRKKLSEALEDCKCDAYKLILDSVKHRESKIASNKYHAKADLLLNEFDLEEYKKLTNEVIKFLSEDDAHSYKEIIEHLQKDSETDIQANLVWIATNTISRNDAFDFMRIEAEEIYYSFLSWYFKEKYKKIHKKLNYYERRMFKLMYMRRSYFGYRIPIIEPLFFSYAFTGDNLSKALIILALVLKKKEFGGEDVPKLLTEKWLSYLQLYPQLTDEYIPFYEMISTTNLRQNMLREICNNEELEIVKFFSRGKDIDFIALQANKSKSEVITSLNNIGMRLQQQRKALGNGKHRKKIRKNTTKM